MIVMISMLDLALKSLPQETQTQLRAATPMTLMILISVMSLRVNEKRVNKKKMNSISISTEVAASHKRSRIQLQLPIQVGICWIYSETHLIISNKIPISRLANLTHSPWTSVLQVV
jgi:hypothetical protein